MMNDRLERVQVGREADVPIEILKNWYLVVKDDGSWDAGQSNDNDFVEHLNDPHTKHVFCVWHGEWKTNLFLMDKKKLIKRFKKLGCYAFQD